MNKTAGASLVVLLLIVSAFAACGDSKRAGEGELIVAAASNFSEAFEEIGREYERRTGIRVVNVFSSTADLARQIENGAPFDVFASADVKSVEALASKRLLATGSTRDFARGRLVLWTPANRYALNSLSDLTSQSVSRIAIASPSVAPYGAAAVEALRSAGLMDAVEPKLVFAQNAVQAKQFAATGNAEAAFVPSSLVRESGGHIMEIDEKLHKPLIHTVAVLNKSERREAADGFLEFLTSEDGGARILLEHGYSIPEPKDGRARK